MIREITLGQYYQADSVIHRLDPRVKLVGTILYIVSLFLFKKAAPYVLAVIFLAAVISLSKVPFSYMVRGLKAIMILLLITAAFNMHPLTKIKVPVHEISMMMSIALRFIPILLEETDKIMKAQMARGADFESGNLIKKIKAMIPLLVPLFVSAFRRANDLAMAMEARCYQGGDNRTKMKPLKYHKRDSISYGILLVYLAGIILLGKTISIGML